MTPPLLPADIWAAVAEYLPLRGASAWAAAVSPWARRRVWPFVLRARRRRWLASVPMHAVERFALERSAWRSRAVALFLARRAGACSLAARVALDPRATRAMVSMVASFCRRPANAPDTTYHYVRHAHADLLRWPAHFVPMALPGVDEMMTLPHCHLRCGELHLRDGMLYAGAFVVARVTARGVWPTRLITARAYAWLRELEADAVDALGRYAQRCPFCGDEAVDLAGGGGLVAPAPDESCSMRYAKWADWIRVVQQRKRRTRTRSREGGRDLMVIDGVP
jgi:hypothetical protein